MLLLPRRAWIGGLVSTTLCSSSVLIEDVAKFILTNTPRDFLEAISNTNGNFLYRGEQAPEAKQSMAGTICSPAPDLLLEGTYGDDVKALQYFECLEQYLSKQDTDIVAKPSTGHIGTSDPRVARQWGDVVSVWPLGDSLSYVYPKDQSTFYPDCACQQADNDKESSQYVMDTDLETALVSQKEVLFASWYSKTQSKSGSTIPSSAFLAVPQRHDKKLKEILESMNYGLMNWRYLVRLVRTPWCVHLL